MSAFTQALRFRDDTNTLREKLIHDIEKGIVPLEKIQHLPLHLLDTSRLPNVASNNLTVPSTVYKPFRYEFGYEVAILQNKLHWLPEEIPLADDVKDWHAKLSEAEVNLVTQIFRLFTQNDMFVNNVYLTHYPKFSRANELLMGIAAISNIEVIHQVAYSHLLDTIGMPETEYSAFMSYKEMSDKYDYMHSFKTDTLFGIALALVIFGGMMEGVQLFASFAMLQNFPRDKGPGTVSTMKGMGQIVSWSQRDESLHVQFVAYLFSTLMHEFRALINVPALTEAVVASTRRIVENEHHFIDLAFEMGPVTGMTARDLKDYVMFIANKRLNQFGFADIYPIKVNPIPWVEAETNAMEMTNFFENRPTDYSRGGTLGTWEDAYDSYRSVHGSAQ